MQTPTSEGPFDPKPGREPEEENGDLLTPGVILEQLRAHDKRMKLGYDGWSEIKALYNTKHLEYLRGAGSVTLEHRQAEVEVETNRLKPVITGYLAALYPRSPRAICSADPGSKGDPEKTSLAINQWLQSKRVHKRITSALRQALLYPGCAAVVGYKPGYGSALGRVWLRIAPWWEVVLDADAGDDEDERFRGRAYHRPRKEIEAEYGLRGLKGCPRVDFLTPERRASIGFGEDTYPDGGDGVAPSDRDAFVRVLEVCNLVDPWRGHGVETQGRLEIYLLGQSDPKYKKPVHIGPLPFNHPDGRPLPHVVPLIFDYEPEYPRRGIPHAQRLVPQLREMNGYRRFMALSTRKDVRTYLVRKGYLSSDKMAQLVSGADGLVIEVEKDEPRSLEDIIVAIKHAPISSNILQYLGIVEADLEREIGTSPNARGQITKSTAFEARVVQEYTESEYGMHAEIRDQWLADVAMVLLRAIISAMKDTGDSAGAFDAEPHKLGEVGAEPVRDEGAARPENGPQEAQEVVAAEETAGAPPLVAGRSVPALGRQDAGPAIEVRTAVLQLQKNKQAVKVTVQDLDGAFDIYFDESARTPLADETVQRNLVGLMDSYFKLWEQAQDPGPMGALALAYMRVMAERFDLPRDLHPDNLQQQLQASDEKGQKGKSAPKKKGAPKNGAAQPAQPPPGDGAPDEGEMQDFLARIAQLPPEDAIAQLRTLFADNPDVVAALDQAATLPPDQQARVVAQLLQQAAPAPAGA